MGKLDRVGLLLLVLALALAHECIHDKVPHVKIEKHTTEPRLRLESHVENDKKLHRERQQTNFKPFRIHFHNDNLNNMVPDPEKLSYFKNRLLPAAKNYFERSLFVYPASSPIVVKSRWCEASPDHDVSKIGVETDLILVMVATSAPDENWAAQAGACQIDPNLLGRATVGIIYFNLPYCGNNFEIDLNIVIHEVTHVLGFSRYRYYDFVNPDGTPVQNPVTTLATAVGEYQALTLPLIVDMAKDYYGCDDVKGIGLENAGSDGTIGSHWDRLYVFNDVMSPSLVFSTRKSIFTFTFLEATGWYKYNPDMIEDITYGKGGGCDFLTNFCKKPSHYFCSVRGFSEGCSYNNDGFANCHGDIYSSPCLLAASFPCAGFNRSYDPYANFAGGDYGPGTKCIDTDAITKYYRWLTPNGRRPTCHKIECENGKAHIIFNNGQTLERVTCTTEGEVVPVPESYSGTITCPKISNLCGKVSKCPKDCFGQGVCLDGKCKCYFGFQGADCGQQTCPNGCSGRGYCDRSGKCYCNTGFTGAGCEKVASRR